MIKTLYLIELKLSLRDMNMPMFAVGFPVGLFFIMYLINTNLVSVPAISAIAIAAAGLMGLPMVLSDYRERRILKRLQVTPVKPIILIFVQIMLNATYSLITLTLLLLLTPLTSIAPPTDYFLFIITYLVVLMAIYSIGMMVSAIAKNMKTASLISALLYFPMLILSGATIPYTQLPRSLQTISDWLPLTQGIHMLNEGYTGALNMTQLLIMIATILVSLIITIKYFRWA